MSIVELTFQQEAHATLVRRVKLLSWLSLAWMTAEGAIGVTAGILANSIALIGYGLDSTIEGIASIVVIWRFTGPRIHSEKAEAKAQRVVAVSFFLLAPYIIVEAIHRLLAGQEARPSWVGIGLAILSIKPAYAHGVGKDAATPARERPISKEEPQDFNSSRPGLLLLVAS
jgi:divalent metal cation (Fe/Co/Zn/Cd) transporter